MRGAILFSTGALCVLAALGGFRLGQQRLHFNDATGVIEAVAARHVERHGGEIPDCLGWLGPEGEVLNVRCGDARYRVDRLGRITDVAEPDA